MTEYCEELLEAFVEEIIAQAPDVLILTGDLTFNGEKRSHERMAEKLRQIEDAGIRVLFSPEIMIWKIPWPQPFPETDIL